MKHVFMYINRSFASPAKADFLAFRLTRYRKTDVRKEKHNLGGLTSKIDVYPIKFAWELMENMGM